MENQHRHISGYRDLSKQEIDLMNEIKAKGVELEALVEKLDAHVRGQRADAKALGQVGSQEAAVQAKDEFDRMDRAQPEHWLYYGRSQLQTALMFLTRAVAQPTIF